MKKMVGALLVLFLVISSIAIADGIVIPNWESHVMPPLPDVQMFYMTYHYVTITVENGIAKVRIEEEFVNPNSMPIEAEYIFPVPLGAVIDRFSMIVGDQVYEGKVLPAEEARKIYQDIVRRMKDPALLEYANSRMVRMKVYPFEPGEHRRFVIEYVQPLELWGSSYTMTYPLKIESMLSRSIENVRIEVVADPNEISDVFSPIHSFNYIKKGDESSWVFSASDYVPRSDVSLALTVTGGTLSSSIMNYWDEADRRGYFLLTLVPPREPERIIPKDIVFILDISGSMSGQKIEKAKLALLQVLQMLHEGDRFSIITFNNEVNNLTERLLPFSDRTEWYPAVKQIMAGGMTNIHDALLEGIEVLGTQSTDDRYKVVLFLTDGAPTEGITDIGTIIRDSTKLAKVRDVHLFVFGVGYDVNAELLDELAEKGGGKVKYIVENEEIDEKVLELYRMIETPVMSNVHLEINGTDISYVLPKGPYTLFSGTALRISGVYYHEGVVNVTLSWEEKLNGVIVQNKIKYKFDLTRNSSFPFIATLWAQKRISELANIYRYDETLTPAQREEIRQEIINLSKKYNIINEFTSYLIDPESEMAADYNVPIRTGNKSVMPTLVAPLGGVINYVEVGDILASKAVSEMKEDIIIAGEENRQYVGDKLFAKYDGIWTQEGFEEYKGLEVHIKSFSDAYFHLFSRDFWIADVLKLGDKVRFIYEGYKIITGDDGMETVDELPEVLR